jgi:chromate reductase
MPERPFHILGIPGSLRRLSMNRGLLLAAREVAPPGIEIKITDLLPIPLYNADVEDAGVPPAVETFWREIREADALLIAVPEYNYSIPGVLKNAIDWATRPPGKSVLQGKAVALMGAGGRGGTVRSQFALRQVLLNSETYVLLKPELYVYQAGSRFDAEGRLTDEEVRNRLPPLLTALVKWTRAVAYMTDDAP